jgi:hypothetical protein
MWENERNMKTALILFNTNTKQTNNVFLSMCAEKVQKQGFTILHSTLWDEYKNIDLKQLFYKVYDSLDAIFMFIDFGVCPLMTEVIRKNYSIGQYDYVFLKELNIEIGVSIQGTNLMQILQEVSDITKIPIALMQSKSREREIVEARYFYYKRAKLFTNASLAKIGIHVCRDHTSVLHGLWSVNNVIQIKEAYQSLFLGVRKTDKSIMGMPKKNADKALLIGKDPFIYEPKEIVKADAPSMGFRQYSGYAAVR